MKESYQKGVANHLSPESCLDGPRGRGEALTGESAGWPFSSEIIDIRAPTLWSDGEGNMSGSVPAQAPVQPGGVVASSVPSVPAFVPYCCSRSRWHAIAYAGPCLTLRLQ